MPAGEAVSYHVELLPTSYLFRAGHRIGVQIQSADAAHSMPNPNPATNTVYHATTITLPIVPHGA